MKKFLSGIAAMLIVAMTLGGCGSIADKPLSKMKVEKYVTLGDYKNLDIQVEEATVDEEQVIYLMKQVYLGSLTEEIGGIKDRAVVSGDTVIIDYIGTKDEVAFQGGTAEGADLTIGSGAYIDGFEEGLIGVMPGETVDLNLTFPEGYGNADLAGQDVVFTVTVRYIVPEDIELSDMKKEVIEQIGLDGVTTVEEYKQFVYDYLMTQTDYENKINLQDRVLGAVLASCEYKEFPNDLVELYKKRLQENLESAAAGVGMDVNSYCNYYYAEPMVTVVEQYYEESIKEDFALQAIANAEGLNVSDEELDEKLMEYVEDAGLSTVEELIGDLSKEIYRDYFMTQKVLEYLVEINTKNE